MSSQKSRCKIPHCWPDNTQLGFAEKQLNFEFSSSPPHRKGQSHSRSVPVPIGSSAFEVVDEQPGLPDQVPEGAGEHHAICTSRMLLQISSLDGCDLQKVIVLQLVKLATKRNSSSNTTGCCWAVKETFFGWNALSWQLWVLILSSIQEKDPKWPWILLAYGNLEIILSLWKQLTRCWPTSAASLGK